MIIIFRVVESQFFPKRLNQAKNKPPVSIDGNLKLCPQKSQQLLVIILVWSGLLSVSWRISRKLTKKCLGTW